MSGGLYSQNCDWSYLRRRKLSREGHVTCFQIFEELLGVRKVRVILFDPRRQN